MRQLTPEVKNIMNKNPVIFVAVFGIMFVLPIRVLALYRAAKTVLERHIKVRGDANPYDHRYTEGKLSRTVLRGA